MDQNKIKRGLDIVLSAGGMVLLLPVFAGAATVCALSGEGILCVQERLGRGGVPIRICKFRTMRRNTPVLARSELASPETYYIPGGGFLRSTGIDELPQLWSVLKGDMSLIGPRPLLASERQMHRLRRRQGVYALRPGITGLAQLCGDPPPRVKAELDRIYLENATVQMDGAIVLATILLLWNRQWEKAKITTSQIVKFLRNF